MFLFVLPDVSFACLCCIIYWRFVSQNIFVFGQCSLIWMQDDGSKNCCSHVLTARMLWIPQQPYFLIYFWKTEEAFFNKTTENVAFVSADFFFFCCKMGEQIPRVGVLLFKFNGYESCHFEWHNMFIQALRTMLYFDSQDIFSHPKCQVMSVQREKRSGSVKINSANCSDLLHSHQSSFQSF